MRVLSNQLRNRYNPSKASIRSDPSATGTESAAATATTTTSATAQSSLPSSKFSWPSGNSYDNSRTYGNKSKANPTTNNVSTHSSSSFSKPLFANTEKKSITSFPPPPLSPPNPAVVDDDENDCDNSVSAATSVTARALNKAAQHCVRGQELMSSASALPSTSSSSLPLHASIKEYQSALYILEKTIGSGFADRRECRSLMVMSQIFYWMGLSFQKLATCRRDESRSKYRKKSSGNDDAVIERHERNAIQSFVSCLRLRYHLLDRGEEERDESETDENSNLLEHFVSPLMEIQLVLTNVWESSPSPFCNMAPLESARKLQRLRIATWNEDKGDRFMFAIADKKGESSASSNLHKALTHYRKAMETFSDENHKNDLLRLKIASCYRQSGLQKKNNGNDDGASRDFDAAVFWYRSALKAFCATVRFFVPPSDAVVTSTTPTIAQKQSPYPQSPTPSVSSIDMSSTCSFDDEGNYTTLNPETIMTKHPTYERILLRIEEILSWKQNQQQRQKQKQKFKKSKGGVSGTEGTSIEQETTMRDYLRVKMKESIAHQSRAESMLSPTAAWRRKAPKSLYLQSEGLKLEDEAASTMSSMSVLANALIILRASLRIEEAVWGASHPIVLSIQEEINSADEEYLDTEEQHAESAEITQRVQKTTIKTKEYNDFHAHIEKLMDDNERLRNALDDGAENMDSSNKNRTLPNQQKSEDPSHDKVTAVNKSIPPLKRPVEYVNIVPTQLIDDKNNSLDTQGDATKQNFPANYFVQKNSVQPQFPPERDDQLESFINRCKVLEEELREAKEKIRCLNQKVEKKKPSQQEQQQHRNGHLEKRCRELEDELKQSSNLLEDLSEQYRSLEAKFEDQVSIQSENSDEAQKAKEENAILSNRLARINAELQASKAGSEVLRKKLEEKYESVSKKLEKAEIDLQSSQIRCVELENLEAKAREEQAKIKSDTEEYAERYNKAEADLELARMRCTELEKNQEKREEVHSAQEAKSRLEKENANLLVRCTAAESELQESKERNIQLESDLEKQVEDKSNLQQQQEEPEASAEQNETALREENNRLQILCKELENNMILTKDQSEKLALKLRNELTQVEEELGLSKLGHSKLKSELDGLKEAEVDDKATLVIRVSQLENDIEQLAKDGDLTRMNLERERDELHEKIQKQQQLHSVMAKEHELTIIALKKDIKTAQDAQRERDDRINELEKKLDEKEVMGDTVKALELADKSSMNATEDGENNESIVNDIPSPDIDIDVSERVHSIEKERLTNRITVLKKELEFAQEKSKIENERLERELSEKLEKEQARVKELENNAEDGKQALKLLEMKLAEMVVNEQKKEAIASRIANLEVENRSIEQDLKNMTEQKEKESKSAQILQMQISKLEQDVALGEVNYNKLKSQFVELSKANQSTAQELKEMTETKEREKKESQNLNEQISNLEKNLEDSKKHTEEQNQLQVTISELRGELQDMSNKNDTMSSQLKSIKVKGEKYDFVVARCVELEKELENTKNESDGLEMLTKQVGELKQELESSMKKQSEAAFELQSVKSNLKNEKQLHDKIKQDHRDLLEKYNRIVNDAKDSQLTSDKNAAIAGGRILTLINSLNEVTKERDAIAMKMSKIEGDTSVVQLEQKESETRLVEREYETDSARSEDETESTNSTKSLADLKAELATTKAYNENLCRTLESYVEEKKGLLEQINRLAEKKAIVDQPPLKSVETIQKQLECELEKNREEKEKLAEQISTLRGDIAATEDVNKKLGLDLEKSDDKSKKLQLELQVKLSEVVEYAKRVSTLESEIGSVSSSNKKLVSMNESVQKDVLELQATLMQKKKECDLLLQKSMSLEKELDLSTSKNGELTARVESLDTEKESHELRLKENSLEREDFVARVSALQNELDLKCAENDALATEMVSLNEAKNENELLSSRVSSLEDKLKSSSEENIRLVEGIGLLKYSEVDKEHQKLRIVSLENELKSTRETNSQLSAEIVSLKAEREDAEQQKIHISNIESELEALLASSVEALKTKEEEKYRLSVRLNDLETEIGQVKATNMDLDAHVKALEKNEEGHQSTASRLAEVEVELRTLEGSKGSVQEQKKHAIERISNLEEELESLRHEKKALIDDSRAFEAKQKDYDNKISSLIIQLETSEKTILGLTEDEKRHVSKISHLQTKLDASKSENQTLSAENELLKSQQEKHQYSVDQITDIEKELHEAKARNNSLTADLECLQTHQQEYGELKSRLSSLEKDLEAANNDLDCQYERFQEKANEVDDLTKQCEKLEDDLDLATQKNHRLTEDKTSFDSTFKSMKVDLEHAKETNIALQARCTDQDDKLKELRHEINETKAKAEEDRKSLADQYDNDIKQKEKLEKRCLDLENLVKESTTENKEITSLLRQKSSQIEALNHTIDGMEDVKEKASEYDFMANQCQELEQELLKTIEFNEELNTEINSLKEELDTLNMTIFDAEVDLKDQAEELQNAQKNNKGLEKRCASLKKELNEVKDQHKKLEEKIAYPDSVEDGQEWTRLQLAELENRMEDVKNENEVLENRMEDVMEENELLLARLQEYKENLERQKSIRSMKNDENLVTVCKELEKELLATVLVNDSFKEQVEAFEKKVADWKKYAETLENELEEESEALQDAEQKNADLLTAMNILEQHLQEAHEQKEKLTSEADLNKDSVAELLQMQSDEYARITDKCSQLENDLQEAQNECNQAKKNAESLTAAKDDLQNLLEEAVQDIHELEESAEKLNAVILAKNEMKRLLDRAELGRDEINEKYGRCRQELTTAKEQLQEAHEEKEDLARKLDIEKQVSMAYNSEDKNEFDELYRNARNEMNSMEIMLEESRSCVKDLEENVQILQHQLQAALTFKLQQPKAKPRQNRKFFGWRGANKIENNEANQAVVTDDDVDDDDHEGDEVGNDEEDQK